MNIPTPCFVLDEKLFEKNLKLIDQIQKQAEIEIILAFKGFAMWSAFPIIKKYVKGASASSLNEVKLCHEEMRVKSHTYCVAYKKQEFLEIVSKSSHLTFNSLGQYEEYINQIPTNVSVGLRINPEWSNVETDLYNPSSPVSRLGITSKNLKELPARIEGLHFHVLCESDSFALEQVLKSVEDKFGHYLPHIKWINMGGGHLITSKGYDTNHLIQLLIHFKKKHAVEIILEPGSAFVWQTGDLHTKILDIVENGGKKTAIFDASFTCHMPDCLEMPYRPKLEKGSKNTIEGWHPYHLGGVSCLAGDFIEDYWFQNLLQVGETLIFKDMIHYTMVKTTTFNGVAHPSIGIKKLDNTFQLIREFDYTDFKKRLS